MIFPGCDFATLWTKGMRLTFVKACLSVTVLNTDGYKKYTIDGVPIRGSLNQSSSSLFEAVQERLMLCSTVQVMIVFMEKTNIGICRWLIFYLKKCSTF